MRRRRNAWLAWITASLAGSTGACGTDNPGFRDCEEWHEPGLVKLSGSLHMSYSGWVGSDGGNRNAPSDNFIPYGRQGEDDGAGHPYRHVYGCALDPGGNLWRLRTYWEVPAEPPLPLRVSLSDEPRDDGEPQATFGGESSMCVEADCVDDRTVFVTYPFSINPAVGEGTVTGYGTGDAASLVANVSLERRSGLDTSIVRVDVDVTWPPGEGDVGAGGNGGGG
jgi:hypothetical protein